MQLAWHGSGACPSLTPLHFSAHFLSLYSSLRCCRLRPRRQSGRDRASPHCRSTLQLLAALSARVMEVPRLALDGLSEHGIRVWSPPTLKKGTVYSSEPTRRSAPRHPTTMASTANSPDPMPCALAAVLLPHRQIHKN